MHSNSQDSTELIVDGIAPEIITNWVMTVMPAEAVTAAGRPDLALEIEQLPDVTAKTLQTKTGYRRYQKTLRAVAIELGTAPDPRVTVEQNVHRTVDAELPIVMDLCKEVSRAISSRHSSGNGGSAGFWARQVLYMSYLFGLTAGTARMVIDTVDQTHDEFFTSAVLDGLGTLVVEETSPDHRNR